MPYSYILVNMRLTKSTYDFCSSFVIRHDSVWQHINHLCILSTRRGGQSNTLHFARVVCMLGEVGEKRNSLVSYFGKGGTYNAAIKGH